MSETLTRPTGEQPVAVSPQGEELPLVEAAPVSVVEVAGLPVDLYEGDIARIESARHGRYDQVEAETTALTSVLEDLPRGSEIQAGKLELNTGLNPETKAALITDLTHELAKYKQTEAGQRDTEIARLRKLINDPGSLSKDEMADVKSRIDVKTGGARARLSSRHRQNQTEQVKNVAQERLYQLDPGSRPDDLSDKPSTSRKHEAEVSIRDMLRPAYAGAKTADNAINKRTNWGRLSQFSIQELKELSQECAIITNTSNEEVTESWGRGNHEPILSAISRGDMSLADAEKVMSEAERKVSKGELLPMALLESESKIERLFKSPSLVNEAVDQHEIDALTRYSEVAQKLSSGHRGSARWLERMAEDMKNAQAELGEMIDDPTTQYWHFTPNTRKIFAAGKLKSGAHEDVDSLTADHSKGIHFIKPGTFADKAGGTDYALYAKTSKTLGTFEKIENPLGAAIVFPLGEIVQETPVRNERKIESSNGEHLASDATFRSTEGSDEYSYDLDGAYIVPVYGQGHVPREELWKVDPATGESVMSSYAEPLRKALRQAGYEEAWIEEHVIDVDISGDETAHFKAAQQEIARRLSRRAAGQRIVPLTAHEGILETLDNGTSQKEGPLSRPQVEHLISLAAA